MKKTLGLLALTLAVSSVASADQDFLKKISLDVKGSYWYSDKDVKVSENGKFVKEGNRYGIGNEGFKSVNKTKNTFDKKLDGTVVLNHANGVELDFYVEHNDVTKYASVKDVKEEVEKTGLEKKERELVVKHGLKLSKSHTVKGLETSWYAKYDGSKSRTYDAEKKYVENSDVTTTQFRAGVTYSPLSYLDMEHAVEYDVMKEENDDLYLITNANFKKGGEIAKVPGKLSYSFDFNHKGIYRASKTDVRKKVPEKRQRSVLQLQYSNGLAYEAPEFFGVKLTASLKNTFERDTHNYGSNFATENKEDWYLSGWNFNTRQVVKLASPSVFGFEGSIALDNKYERGLKKHWGIKNTFKVPVELSYTHKFNTVAGELTVKPYVSHELVNRVSTYDKNRKGNKRHTTETNKSVLGLKVSLNVK